MASRSARVYRTCLPVLLLAAATACKSTEPAAPAAPDRPAAAAVQRRVVLETDTVRVSQIGLGPGADTGLHTHASAHLAVALTDGVLINVLPDGSSRGNSINEGDMTFVPAGVTHTLRNGYSLPFRGVTIDLLQPQHGLLNACATMDPNQSDDCWGQEGNPQEGILFLRLQTDHANVSRLTLAPGNEFTISGRAVPTLVVALAGTEAIALPEPRIPAGSSGKGKMPLQAGDAVTGLADSPLTVRNTGSRPARFIVVEFH